MGRTGKMFGYQNFDIQPDIITLAKSLGAGVPVAATLASDKAAGLMTPGSHGSTFGGSPIVCAAALAGFEAIEEDRLLENALEMGRYLVKKLFELKKDFDFIDEIRGLGLMIGVVLKIDAEPVYRKCLDRGMLINYTQRNILRIFPPIIVAKPDIDKGIDILKKVMNEVKL
jgi:acetylornithine/succinyldiaminopimelate/putrescine aminotransferase